jgi:hypothetical protein
MHPSAPSSHHHHVIGLGSRGSPWPSIKKLRYLSHTMKCRGTSSHTTAPTNRRSNLRRPITAAAARSRHRASLHGCRAPPSLRPHAALRPPDRQRPDLRRRRHLVAPPCPRTRAHSAAAPPPRPPRRPPPALRHRHRHRRRRCRHCCRCRPWCNYGLLFSTYNMYTCTHGGAQCVHLYGWDGPCCIGRVTRRAQLYTPSRRSGLTFLITDFG